MARLPSLVEYPVGDCDDGPRVVTHQLTPWTAGDTSVCGYCNRPAVFNGERWVHGVNVEDAINRVTFPAGTVRFVGKPKAVQQPDGTWEVTYTLEVSN